MRDATAHSPQSPDSAIEQWQAHVPRWRRVLARWGIQGKLIVAIVALLMATMAGSTWLFVGRTRTMMADILGEQATQISQTLALASAGALQRDDTHELSRIGQDLLKSRNVVLVAFLKPNGQPVSAACRDPDQDWRNSTVLPSSANLTRDLLRVQHFETPVLGKYLQVTAPVLGMVAGGRGKSAEAGTQLAGYVIVGVSPQREEVQLRHSILLSLLMGGVMLAVSIAMSWGLVRRILLPIRQLLEAARRIATGDYSARVAVHRPDEIGSLARAFNEMAQQVKRQQEQLVEANRGLEDKVSQRTAELETINRRLSSEMAEKEDFLRAVSHDLNAPLRNIGGMTAMLLMKYREKFDEDIIHRLERIQKNVDAESDLINELLELSRIRTRRQKMEIVEIAAMVRDLAGVFDDDLRRRGISFSMDRRLPAVICEKSRFRQVFQNLVDNAIKYMGEGPVRKIHIGAVRRGGEYEFFVRDTGLGIDAEDLPKVFCVFRRGKNSTTQNVAGKGVGLASVKSIVEMYGGRIRVESQRGQGSTFRFTVAAKHIPELGGVVPPPDPSAETAMGVTALGESNANELDQHPAGR